MVLFFEKVKRYLRRVLLGNNRNKWFYYYLYGSFWHKILHRNQEGNLDKGTFYYTALPNQGAGIGHQMANWIAGYWFAKQFGLKFAHLPFSSENWEKFLGFGEGEIRAEDLIRNGFKKVRLPLFDEFNEKEVFLQKKIITSYSGQKVVFLAEQDQYYQDQFGVMEAIKKKFHQAPARSKDKLIFDDAFFNIAIHVRRGDIVIGQKSQNPNLLMRFQGNDYFEKVLRNTLDQVKTEKPIAIYLFSQGEVKDFPEFEIFSNLHFCLDMNAQDSFLHMVKADLLITSKSSFSYKPALLSNGIKVCPQDFWHGYPNTEDWVLVSDNTEVSLK